MTAACCPYFTAAPVTAVASRLRPVAGVSAATVTAMAVQLALKAHV